MASKPVTWSWQIGRTARPRATVRYFSDFPRDDDWSIFDGEPPPAATAESSSPILFPALIGAGSADSRIFCGWRQRGRPSAALGSRRSCGAFESGKAGEYAAVFGAMAGSMSAPTVYASIAAVGLSHPGRRGWSAARHVYFHRGVARMFRDCAKPAGPRDGARAW